MLASDNTNDHLLQGNFNKMMQAFCLERLGNATLALAKLVTWNRALASQFHAILCIVCTAHRITAAATCS